MVSLFSVLFLALLVSHTSSTKDDYGDSNTHRKYYKHPNATLFVGGKKIRLDMYLSISELANLMAKLEGEYSQFLKTGALGLSFGGSGILAAQISSTVREKERPLMKPMFKYVANINGNDAVGYAMMVSLIQYLVYSYGTDNRITRMLDQIDIWIIPNFNPDGFEKSQEGDCDSPARPNGNNFLLDEDFPNLSVQLHKEPETKFMMKFIHDHSFVLSGNLQGGANVVNIPFDLTLRKEHEELMSENDSTILGFSYRCLRLTVDNELLKNLAWAYANENPMMKRNCSEDIPAGVANGNNWNKKQGSMQDYNYLYSNCFELTFYLGCCKYPLAKFLPIYWEANLQPMLSFIESTLQGVYGVVRNDRYKPVRTAFVLWDVDKKCKEVKVTKRGEYWRLLAPGRTYNITVMAAGYANVTESVELTVDHPYVQKDFVLHKVGWKKIMRSHTQAIRTSFNPCGSLT